MKRRGFTRFLSMFLALVLTLSCVNVTAFATDLTEDTTNAATETKPAPATEPTTVPTTEAATEPTTVPTTEPETEDPTAPSTEAPLVPQESEPKPIVPEEMPLLFDISWYDQANAAQKRPGISALLKLYANDSRIALPQVTVLNQDRDGDGAPDPDLSYGLETWHYRIVVPDVDETGAPITYTLKQDGEKLHSRPEEKYWAYRAMDCALLELSEEDLNTLKTTALAPDGTMKFGGETKRFVNFFSDAEETPEGTEKPVIPPTRRG